MPVEPTKRMLSLQALLADDPSDAFLRYGLALEYASAGDEQTAATQLLALTNDSPYVPAFLMAGQLLNRLGNCDEACAVLRRGIAAAKEQGNAHAEGEMAGLLTSIE